MLLRITVFICGAVIMSLEILGARVFYPYYGSTMQVWGALIGTLIGALSLGYWLGGIAADRWPTRLGLGAIASASGLLTILLLPLYDPLNNYLFMLDLGGSGDVWLKPVIASTLLFGPPVALLGAVSPYAIRLASHDLTRLGKRVGSFYAISSVGSIFGTFFTSFYLIGKVGITRIILSEGLLLMALAVPLYLAGFFFEEEKSPKRPK